MQPPSACFHMKESAIMLITVGDDGAFRGHRVQHDVALNEGESPGIQAASEHVERFANLIAISHEPMFAWRLDGPIEFWNAGAERLYGFSPSEAVGRSSHGSCEQHFRPNLPSYARVCRIHVRGRANFVTSARMVTRSS